MAAPLAQGWLTCQGGAQSQHGKFQLQEGEAARTRIQERAAQKGLRLRRGKSLWPGSPRRAWPHRGAREGVCSSTPTPKSLTAQGWGWAQGAQTGAYTPGLCPRSPMLGHGRVVQPKGTGRPVYTPEQGTARFREGRLSPGPHTEWAGTPSPAEELIPCRGGNRRWQQDVLKESEARCQGNKSPSQESGVSDRTSKWATAETGRPAPRKAAPPEKGKYARLSTEKPHSKRVPVP